MFRRPGKRELALEAGVTAAAVGLICVAVAAPFGHDSGDRVSAPRTVAQGLTIVDGGTLLRREDPLRSAHQLARDVSRTTKHLQRTKKRTPPPVPTTIRIGSFNVLGSQHTARGGDKGPGWPSGRARLAGAVERIKSHNVSLVGLQEVQPDQLSGLLRGTGFRNYPGPEVGALNQVNSIIYDPQVYDFVSGDTFYMSNGTGTRAQPVLRLRVKATGQEIIFINTHPPAGHSRSLIAKRMGTLSTISSVVNGLKSENVPIFLTGDMNDREAFARRVLPTTGMVPSYNGGPMPVDWLVATPDVAFTDYTRDTSTIARHISDHFFIAATATIDPSA